jgi:hypothetical protein
MKAQILQNQTNQYIKDPRQTAFLQAYYDPSSTTYSNAYQSAVQSGYSEATAKDILHNRPKWLSETTGEATGLDPTRLLGELARIVEDGSVATRDKLKAIELMMKHHGMLKNQVSVDKRVLNIQTVLE